LRKTPLYLIKKPLPAITGTKGICNHSYDYINQLTYSFSHYILCLLTRSILYIVFDLQIKPEFRKQIDRNGIHLPMPSA